MWHLRLNDLRKILLEYAQVSQMWFFISYDFGTIFKDMLKKSTDQISSSNWYHIFENYKFKISSTSAKANEF